MFQIQRPFLTRPSVLRLIVILFVAMVRVARNLSVVPMMLCQGVLADGFHFLQQQRESVSR